jgi:hypothetical protein
VDTAASRYIEYIEQAFAESRKVVSSGWGLSGGMLGYFTRVLGLGFCEHGNEPLGFIKGGNCLV